MWLSTALAPRVISCAEDLPRYVALPRGCRTDFKDLLRGLGIALGYRSTSASLEKRLR
jgi:hypothetical protein